MYQEDFHQDDFKNGKRGFMVQFEGTTLKQHFTWKNVVSRAASIMFFGSPLSMTQSFDSIFKGVNATTARERFLQYYEQFENNTNACLCVYNSYLARRLAISEENTRKAKKKHPKKNRSIAEFL